MARFAVALRSEMLSATIDNMNSGKLRIYSGTRPANGDASLGAAVLLAELTLGATSFTESGGVLTANPITSDSSADATGTPSFARIFQSDGSTAVVDVSAAASGAELNLSGLVGGQIISGQPVGVSSLTITFGVGA